MQDLSQASIKQVVDGCLADEDSNGLKKKFLKRLSQGCLTRDENPASHFCVFFAGFNPKEEEVFIGHHKKADTWIFTGGHIDQGEKPFKALQREMREEWGFNLGEFRILEENLLTDVLIDNPDVPCKHHFDIWYFVELNKNQFRPDSELLAKEFYEFGWKTRAEVEKIVVDPPAKLGAEFIFEKLI